MAVHARPLLRVHSQAQAGAALGVCLQALLRLPCWLQGAAAGDLQAAYQQTVDAWLELLGASCVAAFSGKRPHHQAKLHAFYMWLA
jgi:hypothetical protein